MIVITAPTGNIGSQVVKHLLAADAPLRLIVRDGTKLPDATRTRVQVIEGSHSDPEVVDRAFAGVDTVFWLVPASPIAKSVTEAYVGFSKPAAEALRRHAVRRVVNITALGRGTPWEKNAGYVTGSLAMDDLLSSTGVDFRAVANPSFMENIARQAKPLREQGMFFLPIDGDRKMPSCATRDIAATAARLLLDNSWTGIDHAAVLGPEDLSYNEMAAIMSDALGKPIRYQQIPFETYKSNFLQRGWTGAMAQGQTDMARAKHEGMDNTEPRTPQNTTPTSFRQWCEEILKPVLVN